MLTLRREPLPYANDPPATACSRRFGGRSDLARAIPSRAKTRSPPTLEELPVRRDGSLILARLERVLDGDLAAVLRLSDPPPDAGATHAPPFALEHEDALLPVDEQKVHLALLGAAALEVVQAAVDEKLVGETRTERLVQRPFGLACPAPEQPGRRGSCGPCEGAVRGAHGRRARRRRWSPAPGEASTQAHATIAALGCCAESELAHWQYARTVWLADAGGENARRGGCEHPGHEGGEHMKPLVSLLAHGATLTEHDDLAPGAALVGRPVWGAGALLANLELRLGLAPEETSQAVRVQRWSQRLAELDSIRPRFYSRSYATDPVGTSHALLGWRDELVAAGWNGEAVAGGGERLGTFRELETAAQDAPGAVRPPAARGA